MDVLLDNQLWKQLIAEFLSTFIVVFIGCMTIARVDPNDANIVAVSFAFGLAAIGIVYTWGAYSGAHANPAISLGFTVAGRMNWRLMLGYWIVQFLAGIAAAALVVYFLPGTDYGASGGKFTENVIQSNGINYYNLGKALLLEIFLTFFLIISILLITANALISTIAGFAIGLTVAFCTFAGYEWTGGSFNPARSLGTAIFADKLETYWVYLIGPLLGAIFAALLFRFMKWDRNCYLMKDECGNIVTDECGKILTDECSKNLIDEYKFPISDSSGNKIEDKYGKVQYNTYQKVTENISYK